MATVPEQQPDSRTEAVRSTKPVSVPGGSLHDAPQRQLRIVFSLLHSGYLRHYGESIRILASRGHSIHLSFYRADAKDRGDDVLLERLLAACPTVTAAETPRRRRADGWRPLAWSVRALTDVLRYSDPRYENADALRERTVAKVRARARGGFAHALAEALVGRVLERMTRGGRPRRRLVRSLSAIEAAIPTARQIDQLLRERHADLVLASPVVEIASPQVEFIKSARRLRVPSAVCIASWDNLTNKGLLRVVPDRVLVWNDTQRRELEEMHGVSSDRVVLTGGAKFDPWFELGPSTAREAFAAAVGLDPGRPYLLYLGSSPFVAPDEVVFVRRWIHALRASALPELAGIGVLVRPHPQNVGQWSDVSFDDLENAVIWPREGEFPDDGAAQSAFYDSIAHSVAVVAVNTTAEIEAGIIGKPVYTVRDETFASSQGGTLHFHYLLRERGGFVHDAAHLDEHLEQLAAGLRDGARAAGAMRQFIESFVRPRGIDRQVAPIVAAEIEEVATITPGRDGPGSLLALRAALYPAALAVRLALVVAIVWESTIGSSRRPETEP